MFKAFLNFLFAEKVEGNDRVSCEVREGNCNDKRWASSFGAYDTRNQGGSIAFAGKTYQSRPRSTTCNSSRAFVLKGNGELACDPTHRSGEAKGLFSRKRPSRE